MSETAVTPATPRIAERWYQEPLAWMVFGLPATVVVASFITLGIAIKGSDSLVVDDYYKQGLEINEVLVREDHAKAAGLAFTPELSIGGALTLRFTAQPGFNYPTQIDLQLNHATRDDVDQKLSLTHAGNGVYVAQVGKLAEGPWYVDASTAQWRVLKRVTVDAAGALKP
jgi:hypothetical protein